MSRSRQSGSNTDVWNEQLIYGRKKKGFRRKLRRYIYMVGLPCHGRRLGLMKGAPNRQDVARREKKRTIYRREDKYCVYNTAYALYEP